MIEELERTNGLGKTDLESLADCFDDNEVDFFMFRADMGMYLSSIMRFDNYVETNREHARKLAEIAGSNKARIEQKLSFIYSHLKDDEEEGSSVVDIIFKSIVRGTYLDFIDEEIIFESRAMGKLEDLAEEYATTHEWDEENHGFSKDYFSRDLDMIEGDTIPKKISSMIDRSDQYIAFLIEHKRELEELDNFVIPFNYKGGIEE